MHTLGVVTHADGTCGAAITCGADANKAKEAHNAKAGDTHFTEVKKARRAKVGEADAEVDSVKAQRPLTHCSACSTNKHAQRRQAGRCSKWTSPAWHFGSLLLKRTLAFSIQPAPDSTFEMDTKTATESGHRNRPNVIKVTGLPPFFASSMIR